MESNSDNGVTRFIYDIFRIFHAKRHFDSGGSLGDGGTLLSLKLAFWHRGRPHRDNGHAKSCLLAPPGPTVPDFRYTFCMLLKSSISPLFITTLTLLALAPSWNAFASPTPEICEVEDFNEEDFYELEIVNRQSEQSGSDDGKDSSRKSAPCTEWKIYCVGRDLIDNWCEGAGAYCDPTGSSGAVGPCSIVLTPSMCRAYRITPNSDPTQPSKTVTIPEIEQFLRDAIDDTKPPRNKYNCFVHVFGACIGVEEFDHALKLSLGLTRSCDIEIPGKSASAKCFDHYHKLFCPKNLPPEQCERIKRWKDFQDLGVEINQCICESKQGQVNCDACKQRCIQSCNRIPGFVNCESACNSLNQMYCLRVGENTPKSP